MSASRQEFARLFREHYPRVFRYVRYRIDDQAVAEDVTAEIFERAYRYRESFDPARASFGTWITQIAHNWVTNHLLHQQWRSQHESDPVDDYAETLTSRDMLPEEHAIFSEAVQHLLRCLERLTGREREVISLRFGSDMRNKDIAELIGMKERSLSVVLMRTLQRLRGCQEEA